jgi:hypothetical protein
MARCAGRAARVAVVPFALAMVFAVACWWAAGAGLGLFFGGVGAVTLIAPGLALAESALSGRAIAAGAATLAVAIVWLAPIYAGEAQIGEWAGSCLVLASYAAALVGLAAALERARLTTAGAAALAVVAGLAWLSWPVWMAPWLTGEHRQTVVAWLVAGHPLFAINGAMSRSFPVPWAQCAIAYDLTNIGDDIPYEMPGSILRCVAAHLVVGACLGAIGVLRHRASGAKRET